MNAPPIAIYGANGHTGRLVAAELLSREQDIVLSGRDAGALRSLAEELDRPQRVRVHLAPLDDRAALRELAENASALIHCAGPYARTGEPVAAAAAAAGCHYVDHAIEPRHVKHLFENLQAQAQRTGAVMIPQMSFYGALADLLAAVATEGMSEVDRITVGYRVTGWRMTKAAVKTAELLIGEIDRVTYTDGVLRTGPVEIRNTVFPFPPPIGPRTMIAPFPSGEMVTIPRHVPVRTVESQLTSSTFEEEQVFTSVDADAAERARTEFMVALQAVAAGGGGRNAHIRGSDIWWVGAVASVEAALLLAEGRETAKAGVLSAAEAFHALPFLRRMEELGAFTLTV
ncbi:saccharopine dehydrogenase NADP-binding domain-containing protein [Planobispora siamensis]|uniref:Saccharopine dehydrogenase n=1 Tax=Planobispora siamensis TaxID=936338 RepID=A0A8J3WNK0_9ACTN|nr:saccharopine dehydrogenase NADP-binding domain-containing protein [Planobispora siamensis]GIH93961.1 saccharopine dehydrogenase [Planobispora siamensis]